MISEARAVSAVQDAFYAKNCRVNADAHGGIEATE